MQHLIRQAPIGPLQQDIYDLIRCNLAYTNRGILAWLRVRHPTMTRHNMAGSIARLIARGLIVRVGHGEYRACQH